MGGRPIGHAGDSLTECENRIVSLSAVGLEVLQGKLLIATDRL